MRIGDERFQWEEEWSDMSAYIAASMIPLMKGEWT